MTNEDVTPIVQPIVPPPQSSNRPSEAGALTRETLMTILHTLKKRRSAPDAAVALRDALDRIADEPARHPWAVLFGPDASKPALADQD